jgi:hypothetical protein
MSLIENLAPQMTAYSKQFHTDGDVEWLPYLMFFHPPNYSSEVVNTDSYGFRYSELDTKKYSIATSSELSSARLIAGNSVVFGIGATSDKATLASRMMVHDTRPEPWLNFGGRAFNSAQELILLTLYRHLLPKIEEIILFSGVNDLLLARLPEAYIKEHGAFFNCYRFFDDFQESSVNSARSRFSFLNFFGRGNQSIGPSDNTLSVDERIALAADLTLRHLSGWSTLAKDMGAKLTFIFQPMSRWVRTKGCSEEEDLFTELENKRRYTTVHNDVLQSHVGEKYASLLEAGAREKDISFVNLVRTLREEISDDQWLFIDHTHLTDEGYDLVARHIINSTKQQSSGISETSRRKLAQ